MMKLFTVTLPTVSSTTTYSNLLALAIGIREIVDSAIQIEEHFICVSNLKGMKGNYKECSFSH
jgi:hypothetical protein